MRWMTLAALLAALTVSGTAGAAIGEGTTVTVAPMCVETPQTYDFEMTVTWDSPDEEGLIEVQFWVGHAWEWGEVEVPDAQTVPGEWTVEISGSTARWVFHASGEEDRGGLLSGETAVFRFSATTSNADDLEVQWHLWGDFFTAEEPHTLSDIFELEHCGDVETDDDSAAGDDDDDDDDDDSGGCGW